MKKLGILLLAVAMLGVGSLLSPLLSSLVAAGTNSASVFSVLIEPATADNLKDGRFTIEANTITGVHLAMQDRVCLQSQGGALSNPQRWREHNSGRWIQNAAWNEAVYLSGGYDRVEFRPQERINFLRYYVEEGENCP